MDRDNLYCLVEIDYDLLRLLIGLPSYADVLNVEVRSDKRDPYLLLKVRGAGYLVAGGAVIPYMTPELRTVGRMVIDWRPAEKRKERDQDE